MLRPFIFVRLGHIGRRTGQELAGWNQDQAHAERILDRISRHCRRRSSKAHGAAVRMSHAGSCGIRR